VYRLDRGVDGFVLRTAVLTEVREVDQSLFLARSWAWAKTDTGHDVNGHCYGNHVMLDDRLYMASVKDLVDMRVAAIRRDIENAEKDAAMLTAFVAKHAEVPHAVDCECGDCLHADAAEADAHADYIAGIEGGF
jgi:hypothetical protein